MSNQYRETTSSSSSPKQGYYTQRARLKVFLGMAAGVGKTYAMLEAAQEKMRNGVDVVVGIVNTHGRPDTAKLLENLKVVPQKTIVYKDKTFHELDVDAILQLKPQLVLVDELAHTNIPGSKHLKRWQDVIELLDAGIDVYSTLNVQHIESYKDIVEGITGVKIRETVPDSVLERAAEITCIDLTPAELLQRLKEGKVYTEGLSEIALKNFFQEDRLTALREISLRCTAEMVDQELSGMIKAIQKGKGWTPRERLLAAINHRLSAQQLIRKAKRLAFKLHAPWAVVYVDDGETLDEEETAMLSKNLALARELGAEVITTQDANIAEGIQRVAEQKNITQIIMGKSLRKKMKNFFRKSPLQQLSKISSDIDVHMIRLSEPPHHKKKNVTSKVLSDQILSYLHILFWIAAVSFFGAFIVDFVGYRLVGSIFLICILVLGLFFKGRMNLIAAALFSFIWDFYFVPPLESFKLDKAEDFGFVILFFLAAIVTGILTHSARKRQELLRKKERSTQAIYEIVKEISAATTSEDLLQGVKNRLAEILQGRCEIILGSEGLLDVIKSSPILENEKEIAVARWVFENGKEAGWSTSTLPSVKNLYIPLKGFKEIVGVLAFRPLKDKPLLPEDLNFLYTVVQQLANYLERSIIEKRELKNEQIKEIEQIYAKILQSISEELNPPLKVIQTALGEFKKEQGTVENLKVYNAIYRIEKTSEELMRIAENATEMSSLSQGVVTFEKSHYPVDNLIDTCVKKVEGLMKVHALKIEIQKEIPPIYCDFNLMTILLYHLLVNAIEFSPPHTTIEVNAEVFDGTFALSVSDQGRGIPEEMMELVFEKFYRVRGSVSSGLGLGLAIVKSIAEIHHGWIQVQNKEDGGTKFSLILPL